MHPLVTLLFVLSLAHAVVGQPRLEEPQHCVRISKLVLRSDNLSAGDRERIVRSIQGESYPEGDIGERIREAVRSGGYFRAVVDELEFSFPTAMRDVAKVSVKVDPGVQYRLGEIRFQEATAFSRDQLRAVFSQQRGDLFDATEVGVGLDRLRKLYGTRGYVDMVAVPTIAIDESRRNISLVIEINEGQTRDRGRE